LSVSSAAAAPGGQVTLEISLKSPEGQAPVALQWEMSAGAGQLSFPNSEPTPGTALKDAGKSLNCAVKLVRSQEGDTFAAGCIASGGLKTIANGVVALIDVHVSSDARSGPLQLKVTGIAVHKDLKETPLPETRPVVTVRAK
jgi:hypothetical protein